MRLSPLYGRDRQACWSDARRRETSRGLLVEMPSGARACMTGPRADPEGHRDAAITCPKRLYATGINAGSGPEQPETVGKAPRDSAYPTTRTGAKGASKGRLAGLRTAAGCTGGTAPGAGRVEQLLSYPEHYRPHSGTEMEAVSGRARARVNYSLHAREKG